MATVVVYRARRASRMKGRKKRSSLVMEAIMAPMTDQSTGLAFFKFISCLPLPDDHSRPLRWFLCLWREKEKEKEREDGLERESKRGKERGELNE